MKYYLFSPFSLLRSFVATGSERTRYNFYAVKIEKLGTKVDQPLAQSRATVCNILEKRHKLGFQEEKYGIAAEA
jgi:hypothetical protein